MALSGGTPEDKSPPAAGFWRDRFARLLALVTVVCLGAAFYMSSGTEFLMPGPMSSAHGSIKNCAACHSGSGTGKLTWIHRLVTAAPLADSEACLTCHKMPMAFSPHDASFGVLLQSNKRLTKIAAQTPAPLSARAQNTAFPTHDIVAGGLSCATCHQEHRGAGVSLSKISNEQCRSCHVVKFDSFDGNHPQFENYPFRRRTPIIYDHAGHFEKHFLEVQKKNPGKRIPASCSTCHAPSEDARVMAVAPFEKTCSGCHLDQISGKERATGPKGVAFLTIPGLDVQTLKTKSAPIGEWPDASEAEVTPFMKMMIGRDEQGRTLIKAVDKMNLQDLSAASDDQIKAVTDLVWSIKRLFYALISGKASDVLGNLSIGGDAKLSPNLVADLTASLPRDVVVGAQQQWLPNLGREISLGPTAILSQPTSGGEEQINSTSEPTTAPSSAPEPPPKAAAASEPEAASEKTNKTKYDPPACVMRVFGQCLVSGGQGTSKPPPADDDAGDSDDAKAETDDSKERRAASKLPEPMRAGVADAELPAKTPSGGEKANQTDDLLHPSPEELREIKARGTNANAPAPGQGAPSHVGASMPVTKAPVIISIASDVDPESWAEYGGWYRQDYGIFYRPAGHKDKFIYSWLFLTGPQAPKGDRSPAAAVFDYLTTKDAQGSCTKCHSVDDLQGRGRVVNFSPPSTATKQGSFTTFLHEPHFGVLENRGCLTCHNLEKDRPVLKSYEQGDPHNFASNFGAIKKDVCQSCHATNKVRQDCMTCHKYHVNGVITPIVNTKLPTP